jgi:hypothetical protein
MAATFGFDERKIAILQPTAGNRTQRNAAGADFHGSERDLNEI